MSRHEPQAFAVVFDDHFAEIHGYIARRIGADAADDVAAETFETAFRKRGLFDPDLGTARAWLYGIATRHMSRYQRREARRYRALARMAAPCQTEEHEQRVAEMVTAQAQYRRLAAALARLAPGDRDVLMLIALGGLSHSEVAAALGIPYGTVGSRLHRIRRVLKSELGQASPMNGSEE